MRTGMREAGRRGPAIVAAVAATMVLAGSAVPATAITSAGCFAHGSRRGASLRKCQRQEEAKAIQGRSADPAKCQATFDRKAGMLRAEGRRLRGPVPLSRQRRQHRHRLRYRPHVGAAGRVRREPERRSSSTPTTRSRGRRPPRPPPSWRGRARRARPSSPCPVTGRTPTGACPRSSSSRASWTPPRPAAGWAARASIRSSAARRRTTTGPPPRSWSAPSPAAFVDSLQRRHRVQQPARRPARSRGALGLLTSALREGGHHANDHG